jgi:mannosyl-oligosaccharide alpha-1,3-glucosidase
VVKVDLPETHFWYDYFEKTLVMSNSQTRYLTYDQCCGLYVRAGSVITIKLHNGALSLEKALTLPIRLEVYLDPETQSASGTLYLDDGDTFDYLTGESSLIRFWFDPSTSSLLMTRTSG